MGGVGAPRPLDWTAGIVPAGREDLRAARDAYRVYASVDALADAMPTQLAALAGAAELRPRVRARANPTLKPRLFGFLWMAQGVLHVTILSDTGGTQKLLDQGFVRRAHQ